MDEVRKAVEDLIFYCEEAIERVKKSPVEDFTRDLPALQREIKRLVRTLYENKVLKRDAGPFEVDHEYFFEDPEHGPEDTSFWYQYATERLGFSTYDITGTSYGDWTLWWMVWTDKENHETEQRWTSNPEEVRTRFLTSTSSWVRFLRHKKEQLGTTSLALEAPLEGILTGEQPRRKTGRPKTKQLDQRQLKSILARLDKGETLKQVHKDYETNVPSYHTFRRQVRPHLQNPYGKSKERR